MLMMGCTFSLLDTHYPQKSKRFTSKKEKNEITNYRLIVPFLHGVMVNYLLYVI